MIEGLTGGRSGQVDFARFVVEFADEPGVVRIVWLFSLVLGYSRFLFARYVLHQDLQTLLRCQASPQGLCARQRFDGHNENICVRRPRGDTGIGFHG